MPSRRGRVSHVAPFVTTVSLLRERIEDPLAYPFVIPAVRKIETLRLNSRATFFVGENGSGKSTIVEAIAIAMGLNAEGGSQNFNFATQSSESDLWRALRVARALARPRTMFFLRAESYFNVATAVDEIGVTDSYGGRSLHEQSHGESFFALLNNRFGPGGFYVLDEPEAALSPARQLDALERIRELIDQGSQFVIATHSPILLSLPDTLIYELDTNGVHETTWDETQTVRTMRAFFENRRG